MVQKKTKNRNNSKAVKSKKSKLTSINKIYNPSNENNQMKSNNVAIKDCKKSNKNKLKSLSRNRRFDNQLSELYQRTNVKKEKIERKVLKIAEPRFSYNTNNNMNINQQQQQSQSDEIDSFESIDKLIGNKDPKVNIQNNNQRNSLKITTKNRFEDLENDEILEDGMHSILKMNIKPATFQLHSNQPTNEDDSDL